MVLCAILLMVIVIGVSYAFATLNLEGIKKQVINAGTLSLELDEDENNLTIENALPMYDEVGMLQEAFTFRLINNSTVATNYKIKLVDITAEGVEKLDASLVRYGLTKNGEDFIGTLSELTDGVIDSGQTPLETIEYELRFWIVNTTEDESLISGKSLSYKIDVEVEQINKDYYEFVFHPNRGEGEDTTIICPYNKECDLSGVTFTRNNHTLLGWATSADGDLAYNTDFTLEDTDINPGDTLDLYAVWGIIYIYNRGNQYTTDTGGWIYTRTFNSSTGVNVFIANETTSFTSEYIQWSELGTESSYNGLNYLYLGAGYFEHSSLVNIKYAKKVNFQYTVPVASPGTYLGITYYSTVSFYLLDSLNNSINSQTVQLPGANNNIVNLSLDLTDKDLSSVKVRVACSTGSTQYNTLMFRLYGVQVIY